MGTTTDTTTSLMGTSALRGNDATLLQVLRHAAAVTVSTSPRRPSQVAQRALMVLQFDLQGEYKPAHDRLVALYATHSEELDSLAPAGAVPQQSQNALQSMMIR